MNMILALVTETLVGCLRLNSLLVIVNPRVAAVGSLLPTPFRKEKQFPEAKGLPAMVTP